MIYINRGEIGSQPLKSFQDQLFGSVYFKFLFILTSVVFICSPINADTRKIHIQKVDSVPKIDGFLEQAFWGNITPLTGFVQHDPHNGEPPSEETILYLAFDEGNLYVAVNCLDSEPEKIKGDLTPRETYNLFENDCVVIILDTFFDKRNRYDLYVNSRGVQKDTPGDYLWESAASINQDGWSAEIRIPFKSIRFPTQGNKPWNVNFYRYLFRLKETSSLTHVGRDDLTLEKSAELHGLVGIKGGKNVELFPYSGYRNSVSGDEKDSKFAVGIDAKYSITSNLNLDMTVSPDFSEVESDPFFYQLTPYEFWLREKRPFFQEAWEYLGDELFYTRRVSDPKFAFKLTGKERGYTIGVLGALNKAGDDNQYLGVCNIKKDIFKLSSIAVAYSGYKTPDFTNQNGGVDLNLEFSKKTWLSLSANFAFNSDLEKGNSGHYVMRFGHMPDQGLTIYSSLHRIEKNYRPRAGYQRWTDRQYIRLVPGYAKRINKHGIKKLHYFSQLFFCQDTSGNTTEYFFAPIGLNITSMKEHFLYVWVSVGKKKLQLYEGGSLLWLGDFFKDSGIETSFRYRGNRFYTFSTYMGLWWSPVYNQEFTEAYDGKHVYMEAEFVLKPTSFLNFEINLEYTKQNIKETGEEIFEGLLSTGNIRYQISRQLFISSYVQHDSYYKRVNIDLLLGIELGMGNLFSVSYKKLSPLEGSPYEHAARSFVIKASYLLRM